MKTAGGNIAMNSVGKSARIKTAGGNVAVDNIGSDACSSLHSSTAARISHMRMTDMPRNPGSLCGRIRRTSLQWTPSSSGPDPATHACDSTRWLAGGCRGHDQCVDRHQQKIRFYTCGHQDHRCEEIGSKMQCVKRASDYALHFTEIEVSI